MHVGKRYLPVTGWNKGWITDKNIGCVFRIGGSEEKSERGAQGMRYSANFLITTKVGYVTMSDYI